MNTHPPRSKSEYDYFDISNILWFVTLLKKYTIFSGQNNSWQMKVYMGHQKLPPDIMYNVML